MKKTATVLIAFMIVFMSAAGVFPEGDISQKDLAILEALAAAEDDAAFDAVYNQNKEQITIDWVQSAFDYSYQLSRGTIDDMKRAVSYLEALNNVGKKADLELISAHCIFSLGNIALRRSDNAGAEKRYLEALPLYRKAGDIPGEANCIMRLGDIALYTSDNAGAEKRYLEALPLYRKAGDILGEANCIRGLGDIALFTSDNAGAEKRYLEALPLYRKAGDIRGEANCIRSLGDIALSISDNAGAVKRYLEALPLYRMAGDIRGEANCIRSLGDIALYTSDNAGAEKRYLEATSLYASILNSYSQVWSENSRAQALINLNKYSEAKSALANAIKAGLATRNRAGTSTDRMRYQESIGEALKSTLFMLAPHDPEGALELFEMMRGRGFLESLNGHSALLSSGVSEKDQAEWERLSGLKAAANAAFKSISENRKSTVAERDSAVDKVRSAEKDIESFEEDLASRYARYRALRGSSNDTLKTSAGSLKDGETAIVFIATSKGTGAWIVAKNGAGFTCEFIDCGIDSAGLSGGIASLRYNITSDSKERGMRVEDAGDEKVPSETGKETIRLVLDRVMQKVNVKTASLVIIPDGGLGLVPWESVEYKGKPLVYSYPVSYVPTLAILNFLRSADRDYSKDSRLPLAAFGGAYYSGTGMGDETKIAMLDPAARELRLSEIMTRGYRESGWGDLPGARDEALRVCAEYYKKSSDRDAALFSGIWASENAVKTLNAGISGRNISGKKVKLDSFRIIHFATHGEAVPDFPETSRIVLTQPGAIPSSERDLVPRYFPEFSNEDGSLIAAEIIGLSVRADLVVLSACQTGKGKVTATEGIVGLTRAWMVAGANGVVVSLWKVSDRGTRVFMTIFHGMVAQGVDPGIAIMRTQRIIESGEWRRGEFAPGKTFTENGKTYKYSDLDLSSPYYWAAFQYWGK